ncbi:MAG: argininosuccinate lyase, partial [Acidimicrobiia bacterium]|nr:argininosuccinate lyase [Acidimicrobiia bacterium]
MTLWGGRFSDAPADVAWAFTTDDSDRRLLGDDVVGSMGHVAMLAHVGLLTAEEATQLHGGLEAIRDEWSSGEFAFTESDEDVHTAVERRLGELVGDVAGKLHTGRSRNDQVCVDLRLYLKRAASDRISQLEGLVGALAGAARRVGDTVAASYTHLQQAQAIPLAHHLLAYAWMFRRDIARFEGALERIDVSPLGAGAAAGSSLPLDPAVTASHLGFGAMFDNSLDAVSSRDFVAEYAFCCAQAMTHLSRLGEDLVLWATEEFDMADYGDAFTTGSSALPQKRNPDVAELARGKAAAVIGDVTALLTLQKGLPLAYNRDLQEDKRAVFHADDTLTAGLAAITGMMESLVATPQDVSPWVTALDLAEALVSRGVPFREAHHVVGALVLRLTDEGRTFADLTESDLTDTDPRFEPGDVEVARSPATSISRRTVPGAGSWGSVEHQLAALESVSR